MIILKSNSDHESIRASTTLHAPHHKFMCVTSQDEDEDEDEDENENENENEKKNDALANDSLFNSNLSHFIASHRITLFYSAWPDTIP